MLHEAEVKEHLLQRSYEAQVKQRNVIEMLEETLGELEENMKIITVGNQRFSNLDIWKRWEISFLRKKSRTTSTWDSIVGQNHGWYHKRNQDNGESNTKEIYRRIAIQRKSVNRRRSYQVWGEYHGADKQTPRYKWRVER